MQTCIDQTHIDANMNTENPYGRKRKYMYTYDSENDEDYAILL